MEQFTSLDDVFAYVQTSIGARLFTVSLIADAGTSMARIYTTHPDVYPVGGKKTFAADTNPVWLEQVIEGHQPFLGKDEAAVKSFFYDHETIESLGCGAIVNVPVVKDGLTIGSINFLDAPGSYDEDSAAAAMQIAARSVDLLDGMLSG